MSRLKNSIIALAVLMILVGAIAALLPRNGLGQGVPGPATPPPKYPFGRPGNFYLTKSQHNGAEAMTACSVGYHMASIWEIRNPSNLTYNTALGDKADDSGLGPPTAKGWIRTGSAASGADPDNITFQPLANCFAWTSANASHFGLLVYLQIPYSQTPVPHMPPWEGWFASCNTKTAVWCVQD
jgi:hypothetical protein